MQKRLISPLNTNNTSHGKIVAPKSLTFSASFLTNSAETLFEDNELSDFEQLLENAAFSEKFEKDFEEEFFSGIL